MTNLSGANLNNGAAVGPQGECRESTSRFPKYPAYKDSGVEWLGSVPERWAIFSLKRSVDGCTNGLWGDEPDGENDLAVIRVADFDRATCRVGLDKLTYRSITQKERASRLLQPGDLLIEKSGGGEKTLVGCVVLFEHEFEAITSNFVARMRPLASFDSGFLCYAFDSLYQGKVNFPAIKQTTGIQNLDSESYLQEQFCFPTLAEQTQIARFLDHETARIDALIEEQQRLIELLKEKRQAVISHAVTNGLDPTVPMKDSGIEWLGDVPAHWDVGALKHFISPVPGAIKTGPFGSHLKSEDMKEGPYKVFNQRSVIDADFSSGDNFISEEKFAELRGFTAFPGDVLVTTRGTIGRAAILPDNAEVGILHPCLLRVQVDESKITSSYLCRLIQESHLLKTQLSLMSNSTTIEVIYSETMANLLIPVPPITEQAQIAAFLDDVISKFGALTSDANESVRLLQERRAALISAAVTGKIDVRGWQPPASTQTPEFEVAEAH